MNLIIVDYDCAETVRRSEPAQKLPDSRLVYLSERSGSEAVTEAAGENGRARVVLLTEMTAGLKSYHLELFRGSSGVSHWVVVILDLTRPAYKKQFIAQIDEAFAGTEAFYEVIFDDSGRLERTTKALSVPPKTDRRCVVVSASQNRPLIENAAKCLAGYLRGWKLGVPEKVSPEDYRYADAVLIAGEREADCAVAAPETGIRLDRRLIWINQRFAAPHEKDEDFFLDLQSAVNESGWNLAGCEKRTYFSDISYEEYYSRLLRGEISASALRENDDFVMWDCYGLPLLKDEYSDEKVSAFLKENTCFEKIAAIFQAAH